MPSLPCIVCSKSHYVKPREIKLGWGKYCSLKCKFEGQKNGKEVQCTQCGKNIYRSKKALERSKSKSFFCCKSCKAKFFNDIGGFGLSGKEHPNWKNGGKSYRRRALNHFGFKCINGDDCPLREVELLNYMYEVDHINSDRNNNKIENLQILCIYCHRKKTVETLQKMVAIT